MSAWLVFQLLHAKWCGRSRQVWSLLQKASIAGAKSSSLSKLDTLNSKPDSMTSRRSILESEFLKGSRKRVPYILACDYLMAVKRPRQDKSLRLTCVLQPALAKLESQSFKVGEGGEGRQDRCIVGHRVQAEFKLAGLASFPSLCIMVCRSLLFRLPFRVAQMSRRHRLWGGVRNTVSSPSFRALLPASRPQRQHSLPGFRLH